MHGLAGANGGFCLGGEPTGRSAICCRCTDRPDFKSAIKWARQAAEAGSAKGQALLAYVLTYGPESMRDLAEAHQWYECSATARCPEGNLGYALSLVRRATREDDQRRLHEQLRRAAEAELPTAMYLLGVLTEAGKGDASDA